MHNSYLSSSIKQFKYYRHLGQATMDQLSEDQLLKEIELNSNSIAVIVNHLHGNMMSRWTDFLSSDGEKNTRNRDGEFEHRLRSQSQIQDHWNAGWNLLISTLESLSASDLETTVYIRNQGHTVIEAIQRQLCHYSYHVGQMVFIGKIIKGQDWKSLSIPKNQSAQYNQEKMDKGPSITHFTDEYLKDDNG